jgi:hypothetical protein
MIKRFQTSEGSDTIPVPGDPEITYDLLAVDHA